MQQLSHGIDYMYPAEMLQYHYPRLNEFNFLNQDMPHFSHEPNIFEKSPPKSSPQNITTPSAATDQKLNNKFKLAKHNLQKQVNHQSNNSESMATTDKIK